MIDYGIAGYHTTRHFRFKNWLSKQGILGNRILGTRDDREMEYEEEEWKRRMGKGRMRMTGDSDGK